MPKDARQVATEAAATKIADFVDSNISPTLKNDQVGFALMMNTARIVSGGIDAESPGMVKNAGELAQAIAGDIQAVCLRYLRRYGVKIEGEKAFADVVGSDGGVDKYKLRKAVDDCVEDLEGSIEDLCAFYGGQLVSGAMLAVLGSLASDALVQHRELQGGKVKVQEANNLIKAATDAVHRAYCETLQAHGVPIISMDVTKTPPRNPETN